jgi:hypothetical protein
MHPTWLATANTRVSGTGELSPMVLFVGSGVTLGVTQRAQSRAQMEGQKPILALDGTKGSI